MGRSLLRQERRPVTEVSTDTPPGPADIRELDVTAASGLC